MAILECKNGGNTHPLSERKGEPRAARSTWHSPKAALEALTMPPWAMQALTSALKNALQGLPEDSNYPVPSTPHQAHDDSTNI